MGKLRCRCGHVILDQTDFLPYKAEVFSDQDTARIWDAAADAIVGYFSEPPGTARQRWIEAHLNAVDPAAVDDASVVHQILTRGRSRLGRTMYECSECGRIWLQPRTGETRWVSYAPEDDPRGVLRSAAQLT